jgi:hypothetical protein
MDEMRISQTANFDRAHFGDLLRMRGAKIGEQLSMDGIEVKRNLEMQDVQVGRSLLIREARLMGQSSFIYISVGGNLAGRR